MECFHTNTTSSQSATFLPVSRDPPNTCQPFQITRKSPHTPGAITPLGFCAGCSPSLACFYFSFPSLIWRLTLTYLGDKAPSSELSSIPCQSRDRGVRDKCLSLPHLATVRSNISWLLLLLWLIWPSTGSPQQAPKCWLSCGMNMRVLQCTLGSP